VLTGVEPGMRVAREEIFGLNGAVFTSDLEHGLAVAARIRTGTVELNGSPSGQSAPMDGVKASGIGRENGPEGLDAYVELQAIGLPPALAGTLT
jgi:aldehyde dehydrogenase (NAD+)